ncbi:hypothetical protein JNW90_28610 [Micromonospora sp. STR1s_5]|nr:hypothetical protein [Micromonospora sp. STR1s_5]
MPDLIPAHEFKPEPDTSYLLYCPEHGGWHVGEWWEIDGPGRWVLAYDAAHKLYPSHVLPAPEDAMSVTDVIRWAWIRQATPAGHA